MQGAIDDEIDEDIDDDIVDELVNEVHDNIDDDEDDDETKIETSLEKADVTPVRDSSVIPEHLRPVCQDRDTFWLQKADEDGKEALTLQGFITNCKVGICCRGLVKLMRH